MTQLCSKVQKPYFCPFLGPFCPKSREREFSKIWDLCRKLANHITLHFRSLLAKTNDSILRKSPKTLFWGLFRPFFPIFEKIRIFPKNPALSLFYFYGPLTSCKISEKTNEPIMRKVCYRRTSWLRLIYRIFPVNRGSKKRSYIWSKRRLKCYISIQINDQTKKTLTCH